MTGSLPADPHAALLPSEPGAVVGIVGAGGIGATLANAFGRYDYDFALAITIVIVGVILFSEAVSGVIRKRIQ